MEQNMFTIPSQSVFLIFLLFLFWIGAKLFETILLERKDTLWQNGLKNKAITCDNWIDKQRQNPKWTKKATDWLVVLFFFIITPVSGVQVIPIIRTI